MSKITSDLWEEFIDKIKKQIEPHTIERWIQPIALNSYIDNNIEIVVPNRFYKEWLESHYKDIFIKTFKEITNRDIYLKFIIQQINIPREQGSSKKGSIPQRQSNSVYTYLNPKYTFEDFVVGPSNRFAYAASLAVAESPARSYNPLFIYGKVGLGKTHLMQAIGNYIIKNKPEVKLIYISSEKFTNQLIDAIQHRTTLKFRERYRSLDVLLIDDIQFIGGKESTQEEFFHTFNTLYDAHKQIIISSDRFPKEIPSLEERLISRFEWGLVTDIQPPDIETRIAILRKKSEKETITIPNDVINFIAEKVTSNIRELEGALIRIIAFSSLEEKAITLDMAKNILKEYINNEERNITIEYIQKVTADYFNIDYKDMARKRRTKAIAYPRQIAMYLARELTNYSLPEIGRYFGGKDHSTILHAYNKIQKEQETNINTRNLINKFIVDIQG